MDLLLDTHVFMWWMMNDKKLSQHAKNLINNADNTCYVSTISAWEMTIKVAIGKLNLAKPAAELFKEQMQLNGFKQLDIALSHIEIVANLPMHHRDPFDRLLIAQTQAEKLTLISADTTLGQYEIERIW